MNPFFHFNTLILLILLKITQSAPVSKVEIYRQKMEKNGEKIPNISIIAFIRQIGKFEFSRILGKVNGVKTPYDDLKNCILKLFFH